MGFWGWAVLEAEPVYLAALYFLAFACRSGYGQQAMALWEQRLVECGFTSFYLLAHQQATWALQFYFKQGYAVLAEEPAEILALTGEQMARLLMPGMWLRGKSLGATRMKSKIRF